jgi:hypothetical protein
VGNNPWVGGLSRPKGPCGLADGYAEDGGRKGGEKHCQSTCPALRGCSEKVGYEEGQSSPRAERTCMGSVPERKGEIDTDVEPHTYNCRPANPKNITPVSSQVLTAGED